MLKKEWQIPFIIFQTLLIVVAAWWSAHGFYQDDAYISLTYARNLLEGSGLTWNQGVRVEGYSNFLFVMLTALLGFWGMDLVVASRVLGFFSYFVIIGVLVWYMMPLISLKNHASRLAGAVSLHLSAASILILTWCFGGLETNLYAAFLLAAFCTVLRAHEGKGLKNGLLVLSGSCMGLASLTHPEAPLFFLLAGGYCVFHPQARNKMKTCVIYAAPFVLIVGGHLLWRQYYYGEWLPNTYFAKGYGIPWQVNVASGALYAFFFAFVPPLLAPFFVGTFIYLLIKRGVKYDTGFLAAVIGILFLYVIWVGGDFMHSFRLFVPAVPLFSVWFFRAMHGLLACGRTSALRNVSVSMMIFSFMQIFFLDGFSLSQGALSGMTVAPYMKEHWQKNATVAINPVGAVGYLAPELRYIDMLGLNNKHIARRLLSTENAHGRVTGHRKGDGAYVLAQKPDYIIFGNALGSDEPVYLSDVEISRDADFRRHYRKREVFIAALPDANKAYADDGIVVDERGRVRFVYFERVR